MDHLKVCVSVLNPFATDFHDRHFEYVIIVSFQQLMAMRSDALFQDAKSKLQEIRSQNSKRLEMRTDTRKAKRKKKNK